jgi:hypothetical protein
MSVELHSCALPLFVKSANNADKIGDHRDKWVINSNATQKHHERMYEFLGTLIGLALRSGILFYINLAPYFWKTLTSDAIDRRDLQDIDIKLLQNIASYKQYKDEGKPEAEFLESNDLRMTCKLSGGKVIDLVENGSQVKVTYANLSKYIELTIKARLSEAQQQIEWIKRGININFRSHLLRIFTWQELETKVIGDAKFDVEQFKKMTSYKNCEESDEVIRLFWNILSSFEQADQEAYLRFVWGRSRLPLKDVPNPDHHNIVVYHDKSKESMPVGKTCFFELDIPNYTDEAKFRKKLLFAIQNCVQIDADHDNAVSDEEDTDEEQQRATNAEDGGPNSPRDPSGRRRPSFRDGSGSETDEDIRNLRQRQLDNSYDGSEGMEEE